MLYDNIDFVELAVRVPIVLFALTVHEFMHGYVAYKCGDDTALRAGRLTFNPLVHLDLLGTLCLMFAPIGWAKPVPVQPLNFRRPRRDDILVSGAGVAANFAMGIVAALVLRLLVAKAWFPEDETLYEVVWLALTLAMIVNFGLAIFNLLPIPPLDGSHILAQLLPREARMTYRRIAVYGPMVLLAVVLFGGGRWLRVPILFLVRLFSGLGPA